MLNSLKEIRNKAVFFPWDEASKAVIVFTGQEPAGEAELPDE